MNKLLSCRYNMDTNRVEARFEGGTTLAIDCIAVEDEYGNTPAQRAELDWLLYRESNSKKGSIQMHIDILYIHVLVFFDKQPPCAYSR